MVLEEWVLTPETVLHMFVTTVIFGEECKAENACLQCKFWYRHVLKLHTVLKLRRKTNVHATNVTLPFCGSIHYRREVSLTKKKRTDSDFKLIKRKNESRV